MGPQEPQQLAEHIASSRGPSGENDEYLFMLEKALTSLGPESGDAHVQDLAERVRQFQKSKNYPGDSDNAILREANRVESGHGATRQEETGG